MPNDAAPRDLLARNIKAAAERVLDGALPTAWAGEQLAALVRFWGYAGLDLPSPEAFDQFDLVMSDLECFPDKLFTTDEQIREAATDVLAAAQAL